MADLIKKFGKSIIQHGKNNDRVYLMKLAKEDFPFIIYELEQIAQINKYSKIFIKIPSKHAPIFQASDFHIEAIVPKLFNGEKDAFFMSKFLSKKRALSETTPFEALQIILLKNVPQAKYNPDLEIKKISDKDLQELANLYQDIFETYPFPIHDKQYLKEISNSHVDFYGIWIDNMLAAAGSCEKDKKGENAEMTDLAVRKGFRGKKLAQNLLLHMEKQLINEGYKTLYTISRLNSVGVSLCFLKCGYSYGGTLVNNTNIAGQMESMNVFYKQLF